MCGELNPENIMMSCQRIGKCHNNRSHIGVIKNFDSEKAILVEFYTEENKEIKNVKNEESGTQFRLW